MWQVLFVFKVAWYREWMFIIWAAPNAFPGERVPIAMLLKMISASRDRRIGPEIDQKSKIRPRIVQHTPSIYILYNHLHALHSHRTCYLLALPQFRTTMKSPPSPSLTTVTSGSRNRRSKRWQMVRICWLFKPEKNGKPTCQRGGDVEIFRNEGFLVRMGHHWHRIKNRKNYIYIYMYNRERERDYIYSIYIYVAFKQAARWWFTLSSIKLWTSSSNFPRSSGKSWSRAQSLALVRTPTLQISSDLQGMPWIGGVDMAWSEGKKGHIKWVHMDKIDLTRWRTIENNDRLEMD